MRVLNFGKYWRKDGGIETHVKSLCKELALAGIDVVNLVSSIDTNGSDFEADGYRVVEVPSMGIYFSTSLCPQMIFTARKLQKEKAFDLIHLHFPDPMSHLASMLLPSSIPRVITWHSDVINRKHSLKLYRPWQKKALYSAAAIIAPTCAHFSTSQQIPKELSKKKKHIIPFGMDYKRFDLTPTILSKANEIKKNLAKNRFTIFALGRHVKYKGFSVLIDAIALTDVQLILGGEGPLTQQLKQQANDLGILDRVIFTGRLGDEETVACFHACDVFCLPSISQNEAFGLVQLEAMACEKPVICTQLNNGVNVLNQHMQTGLTVQPNDVENLKCAIEKLKCDSDLRRRLGKNALNCTRNQYTLHKMSIEHQKVYCEVISGGPRNFKGHQK